LLSNYLRLSLFFFSTALSVSTGTQQLGEQIRQIKKRSVAAVLCFFECLRSLGEQRSCAVRACVCLKYKMKTLRGFCQSYNMPLRKMQKLSERAGKYF
jgi:hypothetical protein